MLLNSLVAWSPVVAVTYIRLSLVGLRFFLFVLGLEKVFPTLAVPLHALTEEDSCEFLRSAGVEKTGGSVSNLTDSSDFGP